MIFSAAAQLTADEEFTGPALQETIDAAYNETSKRLLEILFNKYQFRDHLKVTLQCMKVNFWIDE